MRIVLEHIWSDWRLSLAVTILMVAVFGLLCAWFMPRGPVTTSQALVSIVSSLFIGILAGFVMGTRWSMLITPVAFIFVFELARNGIKGPTVDNIILGSMYGVLAFSTGRLFHGVLVLAPMILGAVYGAWIASSVGKGHIVSVGTFGWSITGLSSLAIILVVFLVAQPATTNPIINSGGEPISGSIAELISVPIGGHEQVLMIRGRSVDNPVLLYLAGGPGGTDLGAMRADVTLEQYFIVVTWDQRGTGKSYAALDPVETLTYEQMVSDTIEVTNYLRDRFNVNKIYLVGNSWGSILGILAVQRQPELFHAYVGTGQMVSPRETDIMFYEDNLKWAEQTHNGNLVDELQQIGLPPYENLKNYETALSHELAWNPYSGLDTSKEMLFNLFVPENSLMDRINGMRGLLDTFSILYPQLQEIDFRKDVQSMDIPIYIVIGKHEARGRAVLAKEWFEMLSAPSKEMIIFEHSGHRPIFEEPAEFAAVMTRILEDNNIQFSNNPTHPVCFDTFLAPIAFMPDSERILVRAESGVQIFNLATMEEELFLESPTKLKRPTAVLSLKGDMLAWVLEDNSIQLIRLSDQSVIYTTHIHSDPITKLRFSPDGLKLYSASHDGWVKELNIDGQIVSEFQPYGGEVLGLGISADGETIATIPFDGPVKLWDTANYQMLTDLGGSGGYDTSDVAFSSNGQFIAADLATGLSAWDISDHSLLWNGINSKAFAFSPQENLLAYSDISKNHDIILRSLEDKQILNTLIGHQGPVWELIFSPDSQLLASTDGNELRIWRVDGGELLYIGKSSCP